MNPIGSNYRLILLFSSCSFLISQSHLHGPSDKPFCSYFYLAFSRFSHPSIDIDIGSIGFLFSFLFFSFSSHFHSGPDSINSFSFSLYPLFSHLLFRRVLLLFSFLPFNINMFSSSSLQIAFFYSFISSTRHRHYLFFFRLAYKYLFVD